MEPIKIEVSVNIGMDSALLSALSSLLNRAAVPVAPAAAQTEVPAPQPAASPVQVEKPAPVEAAPVAAQMPDPATKEYTEVDVRAAMDRTRRRIEGEDYKEKTDSEGYKKWHKTLTGWFKNTAAIYGAEKPSALPDSESRYKFIACCDAVFVKGDELVEDCPF